MFFVALASDYDGTLAEHGRATPSVLEALERVKKSGRKLILVTGRELSDLMAVFPEAELFHLIVAENGATLYEPATKKEETLAPEPNADLVAYLQREKLEPLSVGRSIVATWEPNETVVLRAIRELGLELQITFNKGAVMILPAGINKASGLNAAMERLGLSRHNVVGIGDAENDHAFLQLCGCSVAVENALPSVKEKADYVTKAANGTGLRELCESLNDTDLTGLGVALPSPAPVLGLADNKVELRLDPRQAPILIAGSSGGGKTTTVTTLLENMEALDFQFCVLDAEGDYSGFGSAVTVGDTKNAPSMDEILNALSRPDINVIVTLLAIPLSDRPGFLAQLLPRLCQLRAEFGRPHWIVIDEAHHMLPAGNPALVTLPRELPGTILVTVSPKELSAEVLGMIETVIGVGSAPAEAVAHFCKAAGAKKPPAIAIDAENRQTYLWRRDGTAQVLSIAMPQSVKRRHARKYAQGELGEDLSFYFRGAHGKLNLRAQNLMIFMQIAAGVDDETWMHHLQKADYSRWFSDVIKDPALAEEAREVESDATLSAGESRKRVEEMISRRYTAPATNDG